MGFETSFQQGYIGWEGGQKRNFGKQVGQSPCDVQEHTGS